MLAGVTIADPDATYIEYEVTIGRDTVILPGSTLTGKTTIGSGCTIGPAARISDSTIGDGVTIRDSTIESSEVGPGTDIGPYCPPAPWRAARGWDPYRQLR